MHSDDAFLAEVLRALRLSHLEALVAGNAGAVLHGAPVTTMDLDLLIRETPRNRQKLAHFCELLGAPLTVTFKVTQAHGTLGSYGLGMSKGNAGGFAVAGASSLDTAQMAASYAHTDDTACGNQLSGTPGYVTVQIQPAAGGWLEPNQPFCTFVVNLGATTRVGLSRPTRSRER